MRRSAATVVCVCGADELVQVVARGLGAAANVTAIAGSPDLPATPADLARHTREVAEVYARASAAQSPYALCSADPLVGARDAWRRRFSAGLDDLEETCAATAPLPVELPDYYLLLHRGDPVAADTHDLELEWYAGLLRGLRHSRVVVLPANADPDVVTGRASAALAHLPAGPWWPDLPRLLQAVRLFVPGTMPAGV